MCNRIVILYIYILIFIIQIKANNTGIHYTYDNITYFENYNDFIYI